MTEQKKKINRLDLLWLAAVLLAAGIRQVKFYIKDCPFDQGLILIRSGIYLVMAAVWGVSLRRRIISRSVRANLTVIVLLMLFWMTVRDLKYHVVEDPGTERLLWYLYYLPMLFIPLFSVYVMLCLGKPEGYRLPRRVRWLSAVSAVLFLLVLTNDLHQIVFRFPAEAEIWTDYNFTYETGYWMIVVWTAGCVAAAFGIMLHQVRVPNSKKRILLPLVPVLLIVLYGTVYVTCLPLLKRFAGDITAVYCLLIMIIFECCIRCGLIQANTQYDAFFRHSTLHAQILDPDGTVVLASETAMPVPRELMERVLKEGTVRVGDLQISVSQVKDGWVLWQEDVSQLNRLLERLEENRQELEGSNALLEAENEIREREERLKVQKRLYNRMAEAVGSHLDELEALLSELSPEDPRLCEKLSIACIFGSYIKRRTNLMLLEEKNEKIQAQELFICLRESVDNLERSGITCALLFDCGGQLSVRTVLAVYDCFENAVEVFLEELHTLYVRVVREKGQLMLRLMLEADLPEKRVLNQLEERLTQLSARFLMETEEGDCVMVMAFSDEMKGFGQEERNEAALVLQSEKNS